MKFGIGLGLALIMVGGIGKPVIADDWDKAGKVLTVLEGLRVVTQGRVDPIGKIAGIENHSSKYWHHKGHNHHRRHRHYHYKPVCRKDVWVPHYVWRKKYVPEYEKYDEEYGQIIVEGHYIKYKVEQGGHWEARRNCY